jgi:hypothetical protein
MSCIVSVVIIKSVEVQVIIQWNKDDGYGLAPKETKGIEDEEKVVLGTEGDWRLFFDSSFCTPSQACMYPLRIM